MFDKKLNSEAIMKTLTSLRQVCQKRRQNHSSFYFQIYETLWDTKRESFETEAEFRGYMILINQSKEDILRYFHSFYVILLMTFGRDVSRLRSELRHSPEVVFALQAQSALFAGNYVKYFKLAR